MRCTRSLHPGTAPPPQPSAPRSGTTTGPRNVGWRAEAGVHSRTTRNNTSIYITTTNPAKTADKGYLLWGARPNSLLGPLQGVASRPRTVGITPGVAVSESSGPGYRHSDSQPPSRGAGTTRNPQQDHMPLLPQPPVIMNPAAGALLGPFRGDFLVGRRSGPDVFRLRHPRKVSFWEFPGEEVFCSK